MQEKRNAQEEAAGVEAVHKPKLGMLVAFGKIGKPMYGGSKRGQKDMGRVKMQKASRRANRGNR